MPSVDSHPPGAFCWIELATTDQNAAKNFYGQLFGWSVRDFPMGPNDFYSMFQLQGRDAGAAYTLREDQRSHGTPPHWLVYVSVESADAAAKRAAELGGTVLAGPFDVFDSGRMAFLQDPAGAAFAVWQKKKHSGIGITGVPGTLCWADLSTPDQDGSGRFYSALFGWEIMKEDEAPAHNYHHVRNGQDFIGGIPPASYRNPQTPPHWDLYFAVSDCDASAAKAKSLGARIYMPPADFEDIGRLAVLADPQGAAFSLFQAREKT